MPTMKNALYKFQLLLLLLLLLLLYSGQIAMVASLDFPQLLGDLSILRFARFLLSFSFLLPISIQETFKPQYSGIMISLSSSWPLSFVVMKFSCGTLMFLQMKFNRSAAFLIFNTHKINKVQNLNKLQKFQ